MISAKVFLEKEPSEIVQLPVREQDEYWMQLALECANKAADSGEVPVGAVVVLNNRLVASAWNHPIEACDPTAHAEISVLREACQKLGNYRIPGASLYVTLEPCVMCVGAMVHARVSRLVYGAVEPKSGAVHSQSRLLDVHPFNWKMDIEQGVLAQECSEILSAFFRHRRHQKKAAREQGD